MGAVLDYIWMCILCPRMVCDSGVLGGGIKKFSSHYLRFRICDVDGCLMGRSGQRMHLAV